MLYKIFTWVQRRLDEGIWFRDGLAIVTLVLVYRLTIWGTAFADKALGDKADLMGAAGVIAAVAGIPVALLTLIFTKYVTNANNISNNT